MASPPSSQLCPGHKKERCHTAQCCICYFDFMDNEKITLEPYWSDAYQYSLGKPIEISNTTYKPCIIICCYGTLRVEACHRACLDLIVPRPSRYLRVAQRSYDATPSSQLARQRRLRDSAASQLSVTPPLAAEIIRELAQYLTSQFAALSLRSLNVNAPFLCLIDTSAPLTQRYAPFETRKYLSSVVNNGQRKEDDPLPQALYVAGNEFGITSFLIGTDGHAPEIDEVPGILWTTIVLRGPSYDLALQSDGYKFRNVFYRGASTQRLPAWPVPRAPAELGRSYPWQDLLRGVGPLQMTAFHYNQPTMTGISICCDPIPLCFHVHCKGDEDLSFYGTGPTRSTWLYIPFAKGEKITAIWMRERDGNDIEIAMLFETSWERKIVVGAQDENLARRSWYKIDSPRGKEAMFYFDSYGAAGRELVFMSPEPLLEEQLDEPVVQQPTTPCPLGSDAEYFMLSSASLENVSSMRPCHQERDRHAKITGMELRYMDGSATALGEVRLDCMGPRVAIFDSPMWLIFRRDSDGNPYLASIEFAEPEDQRHCFHYNYMQVAWSGDIEWWFSDKLCRVWIDDSTSLLSVYETFTWGL